MINLHYFALRHILTTQSHPAMLVLEKDCSPNQSRYRKACLRQELRNWRIRFWILFHEFRLRCFQRDLVPGYAVKEGIFQCYQEHRGSLPFAMRRDPWSSGCALEEIDVKPQLKTGSYTRRLSLALWRKPFPHHEEKPRFIVSPLQKGPMWADHFPHNGVAFQSA